MRAGFPGGTTGVRAERDDFSGLFTAGDLEGTLDAALLLKPTGIPLAAWTRDPVPQEVLSVMAATLWGSLDTLVRTLGGTGPRVAMLEVEDRRILTLRIEPSWTLFLVAPRALGKRRLRGVAQRLLEGIAERRQSAAARAHTVDVPE